MAIAKALQAKPRFILELDLAEAQYVHDALLLVTPKDDQFGEGGDDPVFDALSGVLSDARQGYGSMTARVI